MIELLCTDYNKKATFIHYYLNNAVLVEDVCSRIVPEDELSHLLDYVLDFACDEKILGLYKRVCRRYLYIYPSCIRSYIEAYREMWEDEDSCSIELFYEKGDKMF